MVGQSRFGRMDSAAGIREGKLFRSIRKDGAVWGLGVTQNVVSYVVKKCARRAGIDRLAQDDLRRSCARLCHNEGGELEQIQFLLGHISVQTTERYVGCKQQLNKAVNDRIELGSGPDAPVRTISPRSSQTEIGGANPCGC
jgi:integrase